MGRGCAIGFSCATAGITNATIAATRNVLKAFTFIVFKFYLG
jgi:hypothetical protein